MEKATMAGRVRAAVMNPRVTAALIRFMEISPFPHQLIPRRGHPTTSPALSQGYYYPSKCQSEHGNWGRAAEGFHVCRWICRRLRGEAREGSPGRAIGLTSNSDKHHPALGIS